MLARVIIVGLTVSLLTVSILASNCVAKSVDTTTAPKPGLVHTETRSAEQRWCSLIDRASIAGDESKRLHLLNEALTAADALPDDSMKMYARAGTLREIGQRAAYESQSARAAKYFSQAREVMLKVASNPLRYSSTNTKLMDVQEILRTLDFDTMYEYMAQERFDLAKPVAEDLLSRSKPLKGNTEMVCEDYFASASEAMGITLAKLGQMGAAEKHFFDAIDALKNNEDRRHELLQMRQYAGYATMSRAPRAGDEKLLLQCLREADGDFAKAGVHTRLGRLYVTTGKKHKAIAELTKATRIYNKSEFSGGSVSMWSRGGCGDSFEQTFQTRLADLFQDRPRSINVELDDPGDIEACEQLLQKARALP